MAKKTTRTWNILSTITLTGHVGPVVVHLTGDRDVPGLKPTLALSEFHGHKEWISEAPLDQGVNWYPERTVSVQVWYSWALYVGCTQNLEWNSFP